MPASKVDINLLSGTGIAGKPLGKFLRWSLTYGRYIIITTQIVVLLAFFSRFKLDQDLSDLHSKIEEKTNIIQALAPVEENTRNIQTKLEIIKTLETSRTIYSDVLKTLADQTPADVAITKIKIDKNDLTFSATAVNNSAFANFLNLVRRNSYFNQITLDQVSKSVNGESIDFILSLEIENNTKTSTTSASLE